MIRVLIADDEWQYATALAVELRDEPDLDILEPVFSVADAIAKTAELQPDVVLLDLQMGGLEACKEIRSANAAVAVVFVTVDNSKHSLRECMDAGAKGYVVKQGRGDPARVAAALRAAVQGALVVQGVAAASPADIGLAVTRAGDRAGLTKREVEALEYLALGLPDKGIATKLGISQHTATKHVKSIRQKLGAETRTAAVTEARKRGIID